MKKTNYMANIQPIWKDYYITLNTNNSPVNYSIRLDGEAIFYGKAWCPPAHSESTFDVKINHICENYLSNEFNAFASVSSNGMTLAIKDAVKTFTIVNEDNNSTIDSVSFVYDWSYDKTISYNGTVQMSHPINKRGKDGMYFFQTTFNGNTVQNNISINPINGYTLTNDCTSKWALYYLNRYGGWDSYLIEGYVSKKDTYNRRAILSDIDNKTIQFGNKPYMTSTSTNYEIHTGWMNDTESEIFAANVFPSTRVYLHNLETHDIIPVVITDADALYKNKKNTGRKLINYTVNAAAAQTEHNKN